MRRLPLLVIPLVLLMATPASADIVGVRVTDVGFARDGRGITLGDTVKWRFAATNTAPHSATDATGMNLFDSGPQAAGTSYSFTFFAAGSFPVVDTTTSDTMTVRVPMQLQFNSGDRSLDVTWATIDAPDDFVYVVRYRRPGAHRFHPFLNGLGDFTSPSVNWPVANGPGTYEFRAQLRHFFGGPRSKYSPIVSITVPPPS